MLAHAQANILAELSAVKLSRSGFDSALRFTRIDFALPADKTRASPAAAALAAAMIAGYLGRAYTLSNQAARAIEILNEAVAAATSMEPPQRLRGRCCALKQATGEAI
jgi:hypothetical protein